ncbi:MAG: T9SS type A sorting domain-containing protein [Bacteroidales bacterium]|nr:T9SS type A sorting domain-containing protein [Bacteroidales bacterium]
MASSFAQEAVLPAGGDGTGSGGSVAYSVGQILYTSSSGVSDEQVHGVQQPYEISIIIGLEKYKDIGLTLSTYPNPVTDYLILKVESVVWKDLNFQMYNSEGKILFSDNLLNAETNIDMSALAPGMYLLRVCMEKDPVKTFKIIKK